MRKVAEKALIINGIRRCTLHPVRSRGYYLNSFFEDHLIRRIQKEIYTEEEQVVQLFVDTGYVNTDSEELYRTMIYRGFMRKTEQRTTIFSNTTEV
ncbi:hypothetical protein Kkor_1306 [Kangiella koreensis DSM 16069]|uniref:Uncharacterized protein n=1 Tax=Kangiella koreensis (strain DSM 16069 / JCM 12317 / KCTC 12182 / SW-125) TaxID=523791 RepID=C7RBT0_KANKD|nr:hypothetical protein Kkor_1306 [Kangiella koreensis DSM 16069]